METLPETEGRTITADTPGRKRLRRQDFRLAAIFALSAFSGFDTGQTS